MPTLARADLESLLRARQLDRTLTTTLAPLDPYDEYAVAPAGVTALDASLGGGFPRGQLCELIGPRSSGRTSLFLQILAAATGRGELVALVDALDTFDIASASAAGIDLERLLWVRGHVVPNPGMCRDVNPRAVEQAVKALMLILQAGNFGCVVLDVADAPGEAIRRLPFTTWLRLQRVLEGSQTACILVGTEPMARSSAGLSVRFERQRAEGKGRRQKAKGRGQKAKGRGPAGGCSKGSIWSSTSSAREVTCARVSVCRWRQRRHRMSDTIQLPASSSQLHASVLSPVALGPLPLPLYACLHAVSAVDASTLVQLARDFSPRFECHRDDLVSIDIRGLDRLLGDPKAIGAELRRSAAARGLRLQVAVAATRTAAMVLAHARPGLTVIERSGEAAALAPLRWEFSKKFTRRARWSRR